MQTIKEHKKTINHYSRMQNTLRRPCNIQIQQLLVTNADYLRRTPLFYNPHALAATSAYCTSMRPRLAAWLFVKSFMAA